jgi:hypothetical protein
MRKVIIGGVLSLFMGGSTMAACSLDFSTDNSTLNQAVAQDLPDVPEIIGSGNDEGGFYYIMRNSEKCWKWYPKFPREDIKGMID